MIPTQMMLNKIGGAIAAQADTLAPAEDENVVALIVAPFTPSKSLLKAGIVLASLAGLAPIALVAGAQLESFDPASGDIVVDLKLPLGGLRWESTAAPTDPVRVYGYALLTNDLATLIAAETVPQGTIVNFTAINQSHVKDRLSFRIPINSIS